MKPLKDTPQALVKLLKNGNVYKIYRGLAAKDRFINETMMFMHLQDQDCPIVPRLKRINMHELSIEMTYVGRPVQSLSDTKVASLFQQLEDYGVVHDDPFLRNITYEPRQGQFFIIDFEYAKLKGQDKGFTQDDLARLTEGAIHRSRLENDKLVAAGQA